jgi:hypothetical protein
MKKYFLLALFVYFNLISTVTNAAMPSVSTCTVSSDATPETAFPTTGGVMCSGQPDVYKLTIYQMKLCTAAVTAPTTTTAAGTGSCQAVLTNASPTAMTITKGTNAAITGTITRPPNGTYTHGYILISNTLAVTDSRKFDTSLDYNNDNNVGGDGKYCVTTSTANAVECSATDSLTATEQSMTLTSTHLTNYVTGDVAIAGFGTMNAWLVESDYVLGGGTGVTATDDAAVKYLVGQLAFTTPIELTDTTSAMNLSFDVSNGVMYVNGDGDSPPYVKVYVGPFMVRLSVVN